MDYSQFNGPDGRHVTSIHREALMIPGVRCAGCRKPLNSRDGTPHVDHNHRCCPYPGRTCGKCVRGLTHPSCNRYVISDWDRKYEDGRGSELLSWQRAYVTRGEPSTTVIRKPENVDNPVKRFSGKISMAVYLVCRRYGIEQNSSYSVDDVRQEARLLVAAYAGVTNKPCNGSRQLNKWSELVNDDENQIQALLGRQLLLDLGQVVKRYFHRYDDSRAKTPEFPIRSEDAYAKSAEESYFERSSEAAWDEARQLVADLYR